MLMHFETVFYDLEYFNEVNYISAGTHFVDINMLVFILSETTKLKAFSTFHDTPENYFPLMHTFILIYSLAIKYMLWGRENALRVILFSL